MRDFVWLNQMISSLKHLLGLWSSSELILVCLILIRLDQIDWISISIEKIELSPKWIYWILLILLRIYHFCILPILLFVLLVLSLGLNCERGTRCRYPAPALILVWIHLWEKAESFVFIIYYYNIFNKLNNKIAQNLDYSNKIWKL